MSVERMTYRTQIDHKCGYRLCKRLSVCFENFEMIEGTSQVKCDKFHIMEICGIIH